MSDNESRLPQLPDTLVWLWDASLFIDDVQIGRFYDAVARPESKSDKMTITITQQNAHKIAAKLGLEASLGVGAIGQLLTAFVKPELKVAGEGSVDSTNQSGESRTIEVHAISTPERQLVQLTLHYLVNHESRLFLLEDAKSDDWRLPDSIQRVPRSVVFLNLPSFEEAHYLNLPQTKLIPTAAEFDNGKIVQLYEQLTGQKGEKVPPYPEKAESPQALAASRQTYWKWFEEHFSATRAMVAVETAASENGRIRWIDYRVPLTNAGDTLHLHICPNARYDTGVFAYNLIKRGFKHGVRLVGTLKSEPDMNVLAIYDK